MYTCKFMLVGSIEEISRPLPPNNDTMVYVIYKGHSDGCHLMLFCIVSVCTVCIKRQLMALGRQQECQLKEPRKGMMDVHPRGS